MNQYSSLLGERNGRLIIFGMFYLQEKSLTDAHGKGVSGVLRGVMS